MGDMRDKKAACVGVKSKMKYFPVLNNCCLTISAEERCEITVRVIDRRRGTDRLVYTTKELRLTGVDVDLWVNGEGINCLEKSRISVREKDGEFYKLVVQGVKLQIAGFRTIDVAEVRVYSRKSIDVGFDDLLMKVQGQNASQQAGKHGFWGMFWVCVLFVVSILWVVVMTVLPSYCWNAVVAKFRVQLSQLPQVKIEETTTSVPEFKDAGLPMIPGSGIDIGNSTNGTWTVKLQAKIEKRAKSTTTVKFRTLGYGLVCAWFALIVIVYLVFYLLGVGVFVLSCRAVKRHRKLYGDISGIIEALRAERDKTARDKMKKRILDNLVSTYLGENSDE